MKIEKITIKNFYSFKDVEFNLQDYSGLTLIKGFNKDADGSNGSGKSGLLEAVYFGLTGKTIRKSTEDTLVNNQGKTDCKVVITLSHEGHKVLIARGKKPTKLEFFIDGKPEIRSSVLTTQAAIDEFLNTNYKVMLSSMFFGQANDLSFLDCNANDKRTIIRNFLNVDDIFVLRDKIKDHKSVHWQAMKQLDAVMAETDKQIASLDEKVEAIDIAKREFAEFSGIPEDLTIDFLLGQEKANRHRDNLIDDYNGELERWRREIRGFEAALEGGLERYCDKCSQPLDPYDAGKLKEQIKFLEGCISTNTESINKVKLAYQKPVISSSKFSKYIKYRDLCNNSTNYLGMKEEMLATISEKQEEKQAHGLNYEVMRFWEKAFSEQGIIKYIIKNVLTYFNDRCNYYLSYLTNSNYYLEFDEELKEFISTQDREVAYISLSGGESRKVNLAVTLALKDLLLLTDKSHVDVLFLDEITEGIDEKGIQGLHQLLLELKKTKNIFIITHNKHLKTLLDSSKRITIIKDKGVSTIHV